MSVQERVYMLDVIIPGALVVLPKLYLMYRWAIVHCKKVASEYDVKVNTSSKLLYEKYFPRDKDIIDYISPFSEIEIRGKRFRNRVLKAATYEALCDEKGAPYKDMADFHSKMARGGSSMCIVAYGAVSAGGRSFPAQLICRDQSVETMQMVTSAIHDEGSLACVQLTHAGYFSDRNLAEHGEAHEQMSAQSIFNPANFSFCRKMSPADYRGVAADFVAAAQAAVRANFDCIEIHCGHGYLLSQFLSPKLNPGASLEERLAFPVEVLRLVRAAVGDDIVLMVKMNVVDGVETGLQVEESRLIALAFAECGVDIIGLSGGLILENGLFMLRGEVPLDNMISATTDFLKRLALHIFGPLVIPKLEFSELFFRDPAVYIRRSLQQWNESSQSGGRRVHVCVMGGVHSYAALCEATTTLGFDFVQSGRATLHDPGIVSRWAEEHLRRETSNLTSHKYSDGYVGDCSSSGCTRCNMCIVDATMKQQAISCVEW